MSKTLWHTEPYNTIREIERPMELVLLLKKFHFIATPIGMVVCLTVVAVLLQLTKYKRLSMSLAFSALFFLWICSTPWVAMLSTKKLLSDRVIEVPFTQLTEVDAIVTFSWLEPIFKNDYETIKKFPSGQLENVKRIYDKFKVPIVISSSQFPATDLPTEEEITYAEQYLLVLGVPQDKLFVLAPARSSHEGVVAAKNMLYKLNAKRIVLVETDMRMPRKYLTLSKLYEGEEVEIIPFATMTAWLMDTPNYQFQQWIPNVRYLVWTTNTLHEWLGIKAHQLLGWI